MTRYIARRLVLLIPMLLGITVVAFTFINVAPGDPVTAMIDPQQGSGGLDLAAVREQMGLNKPLPVRYLIYIAITALSRVLIELVSAEHRTGMDLIVITGAIFMLSIAVLTLRYGSHKFPSGDSNLRRAD